MPGPDLASAVAAVENLMDDACTVWHDPSGVLDDTFDRVTGLWLRPTPDGTETYSGPCFISTSSRGGDSVDGGRPRSISRATLKLPIGSSAPPGSVATITDSLRNPFLIGTSWRVVAEGSSTFSVTHRVELERLTESLVEQADA